MSKKNTKGTPRKTRKPGKSAKPTARKYREICPHAYSEVAQAMASDSEPLDAELIEANRMTIKATIDLLATEGGTAKDFTRVSDSVLMFRIAMGAGYFEQAEGQPFFEEARECLNDCCTGGQKTGVFRVTEAHAEALRAVVDATAEMARTVPAKTFISLHRSTTTTKRELQRGEITNLDQLIVSTK